MTSSRRISTIETELLRCSFAKAESEDRDQSFLYFPEKNLTDKDGIEDTVLDITYDIMKELDTLHNEVPNLRREEIPYFKIVANESNIELFKEELEIYTKSIELRQRAWYRSAIVSMIGIFAFSAFNSFDPQGIARALVVTAGTGTLWYIFYKGIDKFKIHHGAKLEALGKIEVTSVEELLQSGTDLHNYRSQLIL